MKITELTKERATALRVAAKQSDKLCKEVLDFLVEVRIDAELAWDEENPTPHIYYNRLDYLVHVCQNSLIEAALMKPL